MTELKSHSLAPTGANIQEYYATSPLLSELPWLIHASTTRRFSPADADRVAELWHLQSTLQLPRLPMVHADQRHTATVGLVTPQILKSLNDNGRFRFPHTDAIVSPIVNVSIAVFTADCAPIFIADRRTRSVGVAHAGWQGTLGRIAEKTVERMVNSGSDPADLVAWIGPMAASCCYEVSVEMIDQFTAEFQDAAEAGMTLNNGRLLDLVAINAFQLQKLGVAPQNIQLSGICTIHNHDEFYSYRADQGTTGRVISMITARSPDTQE